MRKSIGATVDATHHEVSIRPFSSQKHRCIRRVDATTSNVSVLCKGGVGMRPGQRFGFSAIEKRDVGAGGRRGSRCMRLGAPHEQNSYKSSMRTRRNLTVC